MLPSLPPRGELTAKAICQAIIVRIEKGRPKEIKQGRKLIIQSVLVRQAIFTISTLALQSVFGRLKTKQSGYKEAQRILRLKN